MAFLAIAEGGGDDIGAVLVGPFHCHLPPDLLLEGLGVDLSACQEELGASGEAKVLVAHAASDATEGHGAVGVPAVDILLLVGKVPGLENLVVVAQVAEGVVSVDLREAAVEDSDADATTIDTLVAESLASHADKLCLEGAIDGGIVGKTGNLGIGGYLHSITFNHLDTKNIGQSLDGGNLLGSSDDTQGVHPARGTDFLGSEGADTLLISCTDGVVGNVVEVGAALTVALDGLGIEVAVGVESGTLLVGKKDPVGLLGLRRTEN